MTLTICLVVGALALLVGVPIAIHKHQHTDKEKPPSGGGPSVKWEDPET